jgi:hypothetical protein
MFVDTNDGPSLESKYNAHKYQQPEVDSINQQRHHLHYQIAHQGNKTLPLEFGGSLEWKHQRGKRRQDYNKNVNTSGR